ncbi:Obp50e, partial [Drosophila busckii]
FFIYLQLLLGSLWQCQAAYNCSAPPSFNNFDVNSCCRTPQINLEGVPQKCQRQVNQLKSANQKYPAFAHLCYPDCIYRETGALVNGRLHLDRVKQYLQQHVARRDQDVVPHIVHSFETCINNIHGHMRASKLDAYKVLPQGCSPYAAMLYSCVNAETFMHCPAKLWKSDNQCRVAKEYAEQCNPLPHVPLPMS